ncbi:carbohydrate kinase family protein [Syntrophorhabdus aromaticivorans]|uniref:Carbohydrate kinase family protein n=1 Tax=Syntrophorhabdus aromaticivorans TaxID=328301 RepID=A0A351U427_9BACT|nr:PfkB family carbohydrate kinase [Syntrophorhabdus aromaticivorans]NLW34347.1 carbohydrate kinase family protein [Syntrophorhabdus aromaticivorans]HBA54708.1 carbohydrate kinase family protein [Syntrophorhabdus aromaticivorans]
MNRYDLVFMGHLATAIIVPFEGPPFIERGGPAFFGPIAASCLTRRIAAVTSIAENEAQLLEPLQAAGIDLFMQPRETAQMRVVQPSRNVDERQIFLTKRGGCFCAGDIPPIDPCLIHLGGLSDHEFTLEFMRALKARGFRLSVDIQSFVWHVDDRTQLIHWEDIPEKHDILTMVDFIKLDVKEAATLTGTSVLHEQAEILEGWGSSETVITCSKGALARNKGKTTFTRFTNRSTQGRTGRGDTFSGAYLARRLDHSVEESLKFAAALTSIKMESVGPFRGSLEDVIKRMGNSLSP